MALPKEASSFCLFCYNSIYSSGESADNLENIKSFTTTLFRFVGGRDCKQSGKLIEESFTEFTKSSECLNCCDECQVIIDQFLQIYHQLKCLELQLDLKLDNLLGNIEFSSRVPKRWKNVRKIMECSRRMESSLGTIERSQYLILKLRQLIIKSGAERSASSYPRVLVERHNNGIGHHQSMVSRTGRDERMDESTNETTISADDPVIKMEPEDSQSETSEDEDEAIISPEHSPPSSSNLKNSNTLPHKLCEICHLKCQPDKLELHFKTYHDLTKVSNENQIHRCTADQCYAYFINKTQLHIHNLRNHHKTKNLGTLSAQYIDGVRYFPCKRCKTPFTQVYLLKRHLTITSCGKAADDNEEGKPVECSECNKIFDKIEDLWMHQSQVHSSIKRRVCPKCGKCFDRKWTFKMHMEYHKGPAEWKWKCVHCGKKFVSEQRLKLHVASHKRNKTGLKDDVMMERKASKKTITKSWKHCTECGLKFGKEHLLRRHQTKVHSIQVCKQCGKIFAARKDLVEHLESHKDPEVWKWECEECGRRCNSEYRLNEHMRCHTREKIYSCHLCTSTFTYSSGRKQHLRVKHGILDIDPQFGRPRIQTGESFSCQFCGKPFASRAYLKKHCKSQHRNEIEKNNQDSNPANENEPSVETNEELSDILEEPLQVNIPPQKSESSDLNDHEASELESFPILDEIY